ncbi:hypothetical protein VTJ49DRAFT_494 [Mycothermus thermophilus]|uniref:DUF7791 domain-containing protein n=1 Tax=Humicola insolens TaxID=85995 RepID=A0ABR3VEY1_HUMIN
MIVVRSVLDGLSNGDSIKLLDQRIEEFPVDLEPFFRHILTSIDAIYHQRMALYFHVLLHAPGDLTLMHYSFLDQCFESNVSEVISMPVRPMEDNEIFSRHTTMKRRLNARCKGLIEAYNFDDHQNMLGHRVTFLHRTVRDFLLTDEMTSFMAELLGRFPANAVMLMAYTCLIKALPKGADSGNGMLIRGEFSRNVKFIEKLRKIAVSSNVQLINALTYASRAEAESLGTVTACVDELHRTMVTAWGWRVEETTRQMAHFVVGAGLCQYIRQKLDRREVGYEDATDLLKIALEVAWDQRSEADLAAIVAMLLDAGAKVSDELWGRFILRLGGVRDTDLTQRDATIITLLLPAVKIDYDPDAKAGHRAGLPWAPLDRILLSGSWDSIPPSVIDARLEIIQALFEYGANPNAYAPEFRNIYGSTAWQLLCSTVRQGFPDSRPPAPHTLSAWCKCIEIMVTAGADLLAKGSLTPAEVNDLFPPQLAERITNVMTEHQQPKQLGLRGFGSKLVVNGTRRLTSWVWGGR